MRTCCSPLRAGGRGLGAAVPGRGLGARELGAVPNVPALRVDVLEFVPTPLRLIPLLEVSLSEWVDAALDPRFRVWPDADCPCFGYSRCLNAAKVGIFGSSRLPPAAPSAPVAATPAKQPPVPADPTETPPAGVGGLDAPSMISNWPSSMLRSLMSGATSTAPETFFTAAAACCVACSKSSWLASWCAAKSCWFRRLSSSMCRSLPMRSLATRSLCSAKES